MAPVPRKAARRIVVVIVPPVDELDLVGPLQVFNSVNRLAGRTIYAIDVVTNSNRLTVEGEGGVLTFIARHHFNKVKGACDSVLLVCGLGSRSVRDPGLSAWLVKTAGDVRRLGAVCVGSFLLAEAGLLNGRRATTHWKFGRELAGRYPAVRVEHDPLWVKDGNIYTSAGISAGIDLALAWVEEDCGAGLAHEAARELVLFLRRPGGQPQLSVSLASQASEMMSIRELQIWIAEHLEARLSVEDLADRMAMSARNFVATVRRGHDFCRRFARIWRSFDLVLTPALSGAAPRLGCFPTNHADLPLHVDRMTRLAPYSSIFNLTGGPALVLPVTRTSAGLSLGVQLAGDIGSDQQLLALGAQLEPF